MKELCKILIYHEKNTDNFKANTNEATKAKKMKKANPKKEPENFKATLAYSWNFFDFNPLYFLPDICANNGELKFSNYNFSDTISLTDIKNSNDEEREQYQAVLEGIKFLIEYSIKTQTEIKSEIIELLRAYYDITFKFNPITKRIDDSFTSYPTINYHSSLSINDIIQEKSSLYYDYVYQCYSPSDILFSIIHFLALKKYKFAVCMHCGKYFATNNLKNIYCERFSEYPGYEKLDCYNAVKRIRLQITRKHQQIYKNLYANYTSDICNNFAIQYNKLSTELKKHSDYDIIDDCFNFLSKEKWYTKDSIRCIGEKAEE